MSTSTRILRRSPIRRSTIDGAVLFRRGADRLERLPVAGIERRTRRGAGMGAQHGAALLRRRVAGQDRRQRPAASGLFQPIEEIGEGGGVDAGAREEFDGTRIGLLL